MKKIFMTQITMMVWSFTQSQASWSVKSSGPWGASGQSQLNKASGGDGIPRELFQILKDDSVKVLHSIHQQIQKTQQWPQDWKKSFFIPIPKKGNAKNVQITMQQSVLLEGLMLKLKCQYFGHLMRRTDSLEKTLMLGKIQGRRTRG